MAIETPKEVPENGFYYHYKHDPDGPMNNYAYEVIGVGHHTEDYATVEDMHMVVYRPLYEDAGVYKAGKLFIPPATDVHGIYHEARENIPAI